MKRALLTGFMPFGSYRYNPTQDIAKAYDKTCVGDIEVFGFVLPCEYYGAFEYLSDMINAFPPDMILSTGLASRVPRLRLEAVGRNIMYGKYADANGKMPNKEPIVADERAFYPTNVDNVMLANALFEAGLPADISVDAEGFVCNSLIYLTSRHIREKKLSIRNAFLHTPWTDDYADRVELNGKVAIKKQDLRKGIETLLSEMAQD